MIKALHIVTARLTISTLDMHRSWRVGVNIGVKKGGKMNDLIEWYKNRWECIERCIDIPLFDCVICIVSVPVLIIGFIVAVITSPIWGIPYVIYRVRQWKNE